MEVEKDWITVNVQTLVRYLSDSGLSYEKIGKLWGISKLQVYNYANGVTRRPSVKVAMAIYDTTKFEDLKVVLEGYKDVQHLKNSFDMFELTE